MKKFLLLVGLVFLFSGCEEKQNKISRYIQNWTGVNGVLEVYAGDKIVKRFIKIDKLSTAVSTEGVNISRPYRYGYGYIDKNLNFRIDADEKKVYFEFSDYSTNYIFYENPED